MICAAAFPTELNDDVAYRVARGYAQFLAPQARRRRAATSACRAPRSPMRVCRGLTDSGVDVYDIGVCGTEGRVLRDLRRRLRRRHHGHRQPQSAGLQRHEIRARAVQAHQRRQRPAGDPRVRGTRRVSRRPRARACAAASIPCGRTWRTCCPMSMSTKLKPLKIVVNAGNGGAGLIIDQLEPHLPFEFIKVHHEPDGTFPERHSQSHARGESRAPPSRPSAEHGADFGIAWDGDFDRCFFFDEHGGFIEGYYIVGLAGLGAAARPGRRQGGARSAPDLEHHRSRQGAAAAWRCCRSPATPSSSSACARSTASTAAK